jgi:phospholipid/cholesterol/gamma-HCH transport system ATP-binding protein
VDIRADDDDRPRLREPVTDTSTAVRFEDVSLHFGDTPALDHVSFEIAPGDARVLYGAAGSGKTTLLKVAVGLIRPDSGQVYLFGQEITNLKERELFDLRARVGILFQEGGLFDSLNISENVSYPLLNQRVLLEALERQGDGRTIENRVREALRFVELESTMEKFPSELSGGMRRRVGIARAVVTEPALVLYDSPTAGLDPITAHTIIALILKERDLRKAATIMATHRYQDGHLMAQFRYNPNSGTVEPIPSDEAHGRENTKIMVMNQGRLAFEGTLAEFHACTDPYVRKFLNPGGA